ncbi:MAG TPA: hypothetical protein VER37_08045, partial [Thermomicrobiales bacterium]|nr:hypothetical protein [Thermomicrobiales bacterium]
MSSLSVGYGDYQEEVRASGRLVAAVQRQGALIALLALVVFGVVRYGANFYAPYNVFTAFLNSNSSFMVIALGMAFVIMTGGIDLSVGSVAAMAAVAAARLAGLPIERQLVVVYAMSGALAGLAGAFLAAISYSGAPTGGLGWELSAIAAVVVGGTLLTGGVGSIGGTLAGVLLLGLIFNVLNFERGFGTFEINPFWENVIRG